MDLRDTLQETLGATYRFERELGGGGMSRVFLADVPWLNRRIVIKVLRLWEHADPDLQPQVAEVRRRLSRLADTERGS